MLCKTLLGGSKVILHLLFAQGGLSCTPAYRVRCRRAVRGCAAARHLLGDLAQILRDAPQPDPALHPRIAVVATAFQAVPPFQPTDPALNPRPPIAPGPEPLLLFVGDPFGRLLARLGQPDLLTPGARAERSLAAEWMLRSPVSNAGGGPHWALC